MRYVRPAWLTHSGEKKDFEVYSCHVSPDGTRLVTAAGGDYHYSERFETKVQLTETHIDGFVRIWSTEAIYSAGDPSYSKPRQLAYMNYHSGTIHSVRFSGNGKYLASGADDKIVCVYHLEPGAPAHSGGFGTLYYYSRSTLRG